jgi:xylulokinase
VQVIRAMGGGARSALWTQVLADVFARPLEVCAAGEVSALGAAAVALTACGAFPDLGGAAAALAVTDGVVEPGPGAGAYAELLPVHRRLYAETRGLLHALHRTDETRGRA